MHERLKNKGVVVMAVTLDDKDDLPKALKFLKKHNPSFELFHFDESAEVADKELGSTALPSVIVYGKDGQRAKLFAPPDPFKHKDVEEFVLTLLK